jgi:hypothetical protein
MQREPSTYLSRMIVYRGVKVFRICLRNDTKSPVLFVMVRADVEIGVKGQKLSAHKAVLAARSAVFSTEFTSGQPEGTASVSTNGLHQIQIDHVEPSTVEQFLYFIYTGESMETFSNEKLLELADNYETRTLASLCRAALEQTESVQIASVLNKLNMGKRKWNCFTIRYFIACSRFF